MAGINLEGRATLVVEKERAQVVSTLKDMLELSRQSAEENAKAREEAGITESLAEPFVRDTGDMVRPEMRPVDMVQTEAPVQEQKQQQPTEQAPTEISAVEPEATTKTKGDFESILTRRLISEEEFRAEPYQATKGEKFLTIGYGHYGPDVKEGQKLTKKQALDLLKKDINDRLPAIRKAIPSFDNFSDDLKVEIAQSWFRGGISGSPKTLDLINQGKFKEAASEFLNNEEYRTAKERGRAGVIPRMEAVSTALEDEYQG
jgi:GH24 family phage-related lysozyme (muramidase)